MKMKAVKTIGAAFAAALAICVLAAAAWSEPSESAPAAAFASAAGN